MKKFLYILLGLVLVVIIGIAALLALVDPNQFKPLIAEQVKKNTGRELVINGDIGWRFFPSIGFTLGETEFRNPQGFAEPNLVRFSNAELSVSVMPLFSQQLDIGNVSLNDARVFIQTRKDGVSNLDGIGAQASAATSADENTAEQQPQSNTPESAPSEPETTPSQESPAAGWTISLAGVELVNASAVIRDDKTGAMTDVEQLNFSLTRFAPGEWTTAAFDVRGKNGELNFSAKGDTELMIAPTLDGAELKALTLDAQAADKVNKIESVTLTMDQFRVGDWSALTFSAKGEIPDLAFDAKGETRLKLSTDFNLASVEGLSLNSDVKGNALPRPEMKIGLTADATYDVAKGLATLSAFTTQVDEIALDGNASFKAAEIPVIRFDVHSDNIDLDAFLGLDKAAKAEVKKEGDSTGTAGTGTDGSGASSANTAQVDKNKEPDLSALKVLDVAGKVAIDKFKAGNAKVSSVMTELVVNKGVLNLKRFDAKLYDGTINVKATIDANGKLPRYSVTKHIKGVQVKPLLTDVAQFENLAGTGNIDINLSGTGLAEARMRENIAGTVKINFADGAIYGVNVAEMIREARATLKGKKAEYVKEERKTDFSSLTSTMKLGKGVLSTNDLHLASPLLRIDGEGSTNLVSEAVDFTIMTSVVESSQGQGGKDIDELKDLTVPIDVNGSWSEPKFALNLKELLKRNSNKELERKAEREVERGLKKLLGDKADDDQVKDAANKLLKGLFN
ncbi:cell envelope biogenesis protein AsmA [Photobacterium jeanii]|uniref:Cell envelope biogenesis protein AsmA n=1 Tax=Photobacterium jeanii TaxID=858640 RepID=A0A178KME9_9GAMM|nr:AsmA family protein [Photobacterium jeanii]OAN18370.1 cell envelope biogenesis protein AsmA [Photobacterium jeanii]PST91948.1 AsmA family protein [Photobacterium jeanii]